MGLQALKETLQTMPTSNAVLVWREGASDWQRADAIPELKLRPVPPPLPRKTGQQPDKTSAPALAPLAGDPQTGTGKHEQSMRYVRSILQPGERILARGRYHWITYGEAVLAIAIGVLFLIFRPKAADQQSTEFAIATAMLICGVVLSGISPFLALKAWFNQWTTEIAVTNLRVVRKSGFIRRRTWEMNMDKIESVTVDQSIPGRLLGYGTIHVLGTGEGVEHLHRVVSPIELRNRIVAR
jgi:uncharacterized membrane protein YdbT with pleckstrin-like domain